MKIKHLLLLFTCLLLTGCLVAVVAGAAAGMIVYDRRDVSTIEQDARIFHQTRTDIVRNPQFADSRILVTSFNRVVLLVGQTPSASLRVKAEKIARNAPDVYRVYNEISINEPVPYSQRTLDSWITGQIRSQMLVKKGLRSGSIRIVTENGVVYLMGIVTPQQANLAVDVARRVEGVRKVVKIFQYIR
ncbi:BON domain-containing protein [Legionella israelensis]|uniref:BON domain-containing protein n=1 Tax=Legionella israelensis TaxID=454 RepID=UPI00117C08D1|nr:BON domain-containing protein [Legionella israelensis]QDP71490.1 BON domain-containing protein [Legionella israelensis]